MILFIIVGNASSYVVAKFNDKTNFGKLIMDHILLFVWYNN